MNMQFLHSARRHRRWSRAHVNLARLWLSLRKDLILDERDLRPTDRILRPTVDGEIGAILLPRLCVNTAGTERKQNDVINL